MIGYDLYVPGVGREIEAEVTNVMAGEVEGRVGVVTGRDIGEGEVDSMTICFVLNEDSVLGGAVDATIGFVGA